ncbi:MAG: hypothetical protein ACPL88_10390, partial [Bryobacteraceae bacterium]
MSQKIAETIAVSIRKFDAQCYDLYAAPSFGSFVRVASAAPGIEIYGVVSDICTGPIDSSRPVVARGAGLLDEESIYRENPHFHLVLRTWFSALVVGFREGERIVHTLPPQPPRIHGFVYACEEPEILAFTARLGFLRLLMAGQASNDLVSACLRQAAAAHGT